MTARVLVVDDNPANRKLLEVAAQQRIFRSPDRVERPGRDRHLRKGDVRHRPARRDDAGHGRLRGLPAAEEPYLHRASADRHGHRARPARRPRARPGGRRRRFPHQADRRDATHRARALAGAAEGDDRRIAQPRQHDRRARHDRAVRDAECGGRPARAAADRRRPQELRRAPRRRRSRHITPSPSSRTRRRRCSRRRRTTSTSSSSAWGSPATIRCDSAARSARWSARATCPFC